MASEARIIEYRRIAQLGGGWDWGALFEVHPLEPDPLTVFNGPSGDTFFVVALSSMGALRVARAECPEILWGEVTAAGGPYTLHGYLADGPLSWDENMELAGVTTAGLEAAKARP